MVQEIQKQKYQVRRLHRWQLKKAVELMLKVYDESGFSESERLNFARGLEPAVFGSMFCRGIVYGYGVWNQHQLIGVLIMRGRNHLSQLFVRTEYQRQGIGRFLVERAVRHCPKEGITVFAAQSSKGFYQKLGFRDNPWEEEEHRRDTVPMIYIVS